MRVLGTHPFKNVNIVAIGYISSGTHWFLSVLPQFETLHFTFLKITVLVVLVLTPCQVETAIGHARFVKTHISIHLSVPASQNTHTALHAAIGFQIAQLFAKMSCFLKILTEVTRIRAKEASSHLSHVVHQ